MHPADIKAALQKAGCTQAELSDELGISQSAVAHVIYGRSSSQRAADLISKKTGLSVDKLWPGRYPSKRKSPLAA